MPHPPALIELSAPRPDAFARHLLAVIPLTPTPGTAPALLALLLPPPLSAAHDDRTPHEHPDDLAGTLAHEINAPLDGVARYLSLAERAFATDTTRAISCLRAARQGLDRIARLVATLLAASPTRYQADEPRPAARTADDVVRLLLPRAQARSVTVLADLPADLPNLPAAPLFQVLCNLLANAIDVTPPGGTVRLHASQDAHRVRFTVTDTGPGLPEPPERVFEPGYTTRASGHGLGLAIARHAARRLSGSLAACPAPTGGAAFTLDVPLPPAAPAGPEDSP